MDDTNHLEKVIDAVETLKGYVTEIERRALNVLRGAFDTAENVAGLPSELPSDSSGGIVDAILDRVAEVDFLTNLASSAFDMIEEGRRNVEKCLSQLRTMTEYTEATERLVRFALDESRKVHETGNTIQWLAVQACAAADDAREKFAEIRGCTTSHD